MPKVKTCPQCGATFDCHADEPGSRCWCADLPAVLPAPTSATAASPATGYSGCLCPACLEQAIRARLPAMPSPPSSEPG